MPGDDLRSVDFFERLLSASRDALSELRDRGDSNGELRILSNRLNDMLRYAVWHCIDASAGVAFLRERGAPDLLRRLLELNRRNLGRLMESSAVPVTVLDLVDNETHSALLLEDLPAAREALEMCRAAQELGRAQRDKFWTAYADGMRAVLERRPFQPPTLKLSGFQRSLEPCLKLMAALSSGADPGDALRAVDDAFQKRQTDRRLTDWTGLNGDGRQPVRWDYRRAALLNGARAYP